jgi:hypothetical protein
MDGGVTFLNLQPVASTGWLRRERGGPSTDSMKFGDSVRWAIFEESTIQ